MRLDLGPLDRLPAERAFVVEGQFEPMTVGGEAIEFEGAAVASGRVERLGGGARLVGEVVAPVRLRCGRCLDRFATTLRGALEIVLVGTTAGADDESLPYVEQFDLAPAVEEAIVLELPVRPLCRPDCEGLCPRCGGRREDGCGCADAALEGPVPGSVGERLRRRSEAARDER
jgi:uncharacterized protein